MNRFLTCLTVGAVSVGAYYLLRNNFSLLELARRKAIAEALNMKRLNIDETTTNNGDQKNILQNFLGELERTAQVIAREGTEAGIIYLQNALQSCKDRDRLFEILQNHLPPHLFDVVLKKMEDDDFVENDNDAELDEQWLEVEAEINEEAELDEEDAELSQSK